jgi:hypothetical protein
MRLDMRLVEMRLVDMRLVDEFRHEASRRG